jgi:hypothetical protein
MRKLVRHDHPTVLAFLQWLGVDTTLCMKVEVTIERDSFVEVTVEARNQLANAQGSVFF